MLAASGSAMAAEPVNPYVTSSDGKVVMDPFGLCWRTGFWTPALAEAWATTVLAASVIRKS